MDGFIKLHRSLLDSRIFANEKGLKIWVWLLLKANYKKRFVKIQTGKGFTEIEINRGEMIFGRFKAEEELNIDGSTVYKWLQKMQDEDMIKIQSNTHCSVITICKYEEYNNIEDIEVTTNEQPSNKQVTTNEQPSNTPKKDNKDNNIITPKEFYALELEKIQDIEKKKLYQIFINVLYGKNNLNQPLSNILKLKNQATGEQFDKMYKMVFDAGLRVTDILEDINEWKDLNKKRSTLFLVFKTFVQRAKPKTK